jgi:hypothetical protein
LQLLNLKRAMRLLLQQPCKVSMYVVAPCSTNPVSWRVIATVCKSLMTVALATIVLVNLLLGRFVWWWISCSTVVRLGYL